MVHTYVVVVSNVGPASAAETPVTVTLPTGLTIVSVVAATGSCGSVGAGGLMNCLLGALAPGASTTVSVRYTVPAGGGGRKRADGDGASGAAGGDRPTTVTTT